MNCPKKIQIESGVADVDVFPAVVDQGDSVGLKVVGSKPLAKRLTEIGITRLFCICLNKKLKKQINWLPDLDRHSISLSRHIKTDELKSGLAELIVKIGLLGQPPKLPTEQIEFESMLENAVGPISIGTQEVAKWLPKFAASVHQSSLVVEELGARNRNAFEDMETQRTRLLSEKFLLETPWKWLQHYPRYFTAICAAARKSKPGLESEIPPVGNKLPSLKISICS